MGSSENLKNNVCFTPITHTNKYHNHCFFLEKRPKGGNGKKKNHNTGLTGQCKYSNVHSYGPFPRTYWQRVNKRRVSSLYRH